MHVCKENNKTYVGVTRTSVEKRWGNNGVRYKGQMFYRAIQKYGWDNFEHIILFKNKTKEEAEKIEILFIKVLLSNKRNYGYNISNGGESIGKHSEESKKKMSDNRKGIFHTEESRKKISIATARGKNANAKKVCCDDEIYGCITDCAEYYNIKMSTMTLWLNGVNGMPEEFFNKRLSYIEEDNKVKLQLDLTKGDSPHAKKVICDGVIYDCLGDCSDTYNVNISTMSNWLTSDNKMPQKFIDLDLRYLGSNIIYQPQDRNNMKGKQVFCDNQIFNSISKCAEFYNIKRETMGSWLLGKSKMPQEFENLELSYYKEIVIEKNEKIRKGKKIICDGIIFNSISECARKYNIDRRMFNYWLLKPKYMPQEFKDLGLEYYTKN